MKKLILSLIIVTVSNVVLGEIQFAEGFTSELWLSGIGDLRGVTVGPGGAFGNAPYVNRRGANSIIRVTGKQTFETVANVNDGRCKIAFDESGAFRNNMFVSAHTSGSGGIPDVIYEIAPNGQRSPFFSSLSYDLLANGIDFGKGNGFGTDLYVQDTERDRLLRFSPDDSFAYFGSGVTAKDVEDDLVISGGGAFGNYIYMTHAWDGGRIHRMSPNGTNEVFASGLSGVALAFGEGAFGEKLFLGTGAGEIWAYESDGTATLFASGFSGRIRGLDIDGDTMWLTVTGEGELYKIAVIPEPATISLLAIGGLLIRKRN